MADLLRGALIGSIEKGKCIRPRSVLLDPPDDLTIKMEKLIEPVVVRPRSVRSHCSAGKCVAVFRVSVKVCVYVCADAATPSYIVLCCALCFTIIRKLGIPNGVHWLAFVIASACVRVRRSRIRGPVTSRFSRFRVTLFIDLIIRSLVTERPGSRTSTAASVFCARSDEDTESGLLKDFEDYSSSPASPDSDSEMNFEKEPKSMTTVHYASDESELDFGFEDSNSEEEPFIRVQSRKACRARLEASGAITYGSGFLCYSPANKAKTNSGSSPSQDASLATTPTSSWRNAGVKKIRQIANRIINQKNP
ncbi:hypothetical protein EVAR_20699_1 [Eumeta japonica]|uniref:Uncharacterized protein n=1 Tax=Eumeta variegata TaxID=151549 RepID=A0A4C1V9E7_EUMVA|nr:hypothetical protein EVAR_20699_1 [Eumeta japonica]